MAIHTFVMVGTYQVRFNRIMHFKVIIHIMAIGLYGLGLDILYRHISIVAIKAIIFFRQIVYKPCMPSGSMRVMAILTGILGNSGPGSMRPGIRVCPVPGTCRIPVACIQPVILFMAIIT
jgi:hypothetical protein